MDLFPTAPLMKKIDRVTFDFFPVQRMDGYNRDLGMRLLVDLPADLVDLCNGVLIENVGKIVDVARGLELGDRFGPRGRNEKKKQRHSTE